MNYTPNRIASLKPNQIFIFGSNRSGIHGAGAARLALEKFGAVWGQGEGLQGQSYGIPTKDKNIQTLPLSAIGIHVDRFMKFAEENSDKTFLVTLIGCGLAGYTPEDIGPLFLKHDIPPNVILPKEFWDSKS